MPRNAHSIYTGDRIGPTEGDNIDALRTVLRQVGIAKCTVRPSVPVIRNEVPLHRHRHVCTCVVLLISPSQCDGTWSHTQELDYLNRLKHTMRATLDALQTAIRYVGTYVWYTRSAGSPPCPVFDSAVERKGLD